MNGEDINNINGSGNVKEPVLVRSMLEYEQHFGKADTTGSIAISEKVDPKTKAKTFYAKNVKDGVTGTYEPGLMYPSVANFFGNGGGSCYIVSIGEYDQFTSLTKAAVDMAYIKKAIEMAEQATLILPTDLIRFGKLDYYNWGTELTNFCQEEKKYFCVLDVIQNAANDPVYDEKDISNYRKNVTPDFPSYAAAYFPYLKSLTTYAYKDDMSNVTLDGHSITTTNNSTIEDVKTFLSTNYINMPPSPFMAGIYSRLDNATGVWTPPANTIPAGVIGPLVPLTNKQQEDLNVSNTGKSVNAIRSFTGRGTLVWGARTNDGNSLDWRYINVRRLFISMETDISKSLETFVFKPNVHNTWVEVKTMIESYLFGLFNDGAFAGTTPAGSYHVLIGVGETMTDEDVLNGYMRVSIQVAPVRPAEFIVLTFSQIIGQ